VTHEAVCTPFWQPAAGVCGDTFPLVRDGVWHLLYLQRNIGRIA
jgi:hypothetical protein